MACFVCSAELLGSGDCDWRMDSRRVRGGKKVACGALEREIQLSQIGSSSRMDHSRCQKSDLSL